MLVSFIFSPLIIWGLIYLDCIDHVLNKEEATELGERQVQLLGDGGGVGREVLRRHSQRHRGDLKQKQFKPQE